MRNIQKTFKNFKDNFFSDKTLKICLMYIKWLQITHCRFSNNQVNEFHRFRSVPGCQLVSVSQIFYEIEKILFSVYIFLSS